ncbi:NAD(P)-dependent alcohol dehydrogenase [Rhodococcus oxybenzonivorans]|uniref:NAD(P)-dependent alcohol dehydrogenase n=1 Tax=Rhodococcus oxybenzonivorans TaxID=1990687 RepID=UPI002953D8EF|nr:NAD(P)-dependent alcohol dehydrogenase [Rhodococcus oxybenzonivorans]MDV7353687.1 NAD(P)-dependent alcohol dehydrogenase [Rhodococcus oxybenzonivorans]
MAIDIKAAVIEDKDTPFEIERLDLDEPRADEILVKIVASGICQTDAHVVHQHLPTPLPAVLGHEGSGIVERVGSAVTSVQPGDHVVLSYQACGHCPQCLAGRAAYCDQAMAANFSGARLDGTVAVHRHPEAPRHRPVHGHFFGQSSFATHAITTERNTVKVTKDVPLELLAPLGCGLQTGAGAVLNSLQVRAGSTFAVFGTGAVGLAAVMAAVIAGASTIIAVDINEPRLALAKELGATHTINAAQSEVSDEIRRITGRGVDRLLDTTGRDEMLQHAVGSLAPLGALGLVASAGTAATVPASALSLGNSVRGIVQGDAIPQLFIPELIRHYQAGRFPFDKLVRFYPFEDINEAFAAAGAGEVIKPILRIA